MNSSLIYNKFRATKAVVSIAVMMVFCGCHQVNSANEKVIGVKLDSCYDLYLIGNADQARQSMQDYLKIIPVIQSRHGQAYNYVFAYSRLYVIESTVGNDGMAELYFTKFKYWSTVACETANWSKSEILENAKMLTQSNCVAFVEKWDTAHNGGREAKYRTNQ